MSPLTPRQTTLYGHTLSYVDSGEGEAILFVHGLLGSHRNWRYLVDRLDNTNRVIVPDLFGHGASEKHEGDYSPAAQAGTLRDLIDRLGIDRVTIVGHSLGGGISLAFGYLFPERVERLVLVGTGGLGREVSPVLRAATLPVADVVLPVIASPWVRGGAELVGRGLALLGWRASHDIRAAWEGFTELSDADSRRAFLATTRAVMNANGQRIAALEYLTELSGVPVLIVWGTNDMVIPAEHAKRAAELAPACRVELFDGAGHFPHLDQPDHFVDVLRDFMATTEREDDLPPRPARAAHPRSRPRRATARSARPAHPARPAPEAPLSAAPKRDKSA
ncbi:alpha/beta fold hydrolase [Intrasporangium sp. DVR]|uniref:alpha/beta fold hydrolase n=1 Tax=Intrasporangium sp. DVR TaxID=3127867 RepID=UPI00313A62E0